MDSRGRAWRLAVDLNPGKASDLLDSHWCRDARTAPHLAVPLLAIRC